MTGALRDVLPSVASWLGVPGATDRLGLHERVGPVRRVAVVLVDGLGLTLLDRLAPHAPLLASALTASPAPIELACGFPSTTPTGLVSLGTGAHAGEHGILGFTLAVPGTDRLLTHIAWRDDPAPGTWQPLPTWFGRIRAAGLAAVAVLPSAFVGSGLTDAAYRGATVHGVGPGGPGGPGDDPAELLVRELAAAPGLVYGYTSVLDSAAHRHGIASPQWAAAAAEVDAYLTRIVERLPEDAVLLVTADHGGFDVGPEDRLDLDTDPDLAAGLRVVAGEPRARYLHPQDGALADVHAAWSAVLGERADVLHREEAVAAGLFGPVAPDHLPRIGELVVICRGTTVVLASRREPPEVLSLIGWHGGLTRDETAIPLLVFGR